MVGRLDIVEEVDVDVDEPDPRFMWNDVCLNIHFILLLYWTADREVNRTMSDGHEMTTILIGFCSATLIVLNKCNTCPGVGRRRAANTNLMVLRFVEFGDILSTAATEVNQTHLSLPLCMRKATKCVLSKQHNLRQWRTQFHLKSIMQIRMRLLWNEIRVIQLFRIMRAARPLNLRKFPQLHVLATYVADDNVESREMSTKDSTRTSSISFVIETLKIFTLRQQGNA